jgi:hypothetical protein
VAAHLVRPAAAAAIHAATDTDAPNLQVAQHPVIQPGAINAAVLRHLADGQPRG